MKNTSLIGTALIAATLLGTAPRVQADDVEAKLRFNGSVRNNPGRQVIRGTFAGKGEFDPFGSDANINGRVITKPGQRPPQKRVVGEYPVQIYVRATKGEFSGSDNFDATAELRRRAIIFRGYGRIRLDRPISPRAPGRQLLRGKGTFRYDF
jgi:hypothetical protein